MRVLRSFRLWLLVAVVVTGATLLLSPRVSTPASRIAHLESLVKCPSCQDLSVAQSTSASSLAVRADITRLVHAGESDAQILTTLESSYGPSILLSPPTSGWGSLLWIGPLGVVSVLVGVLVTVRRRR
ncbi:MAG: cytochrome c-type biogenesis protein CcmH [Acidobacteria bacterium]|nr:cytochrome c-type biogenesis protein CcmH [Acidobacteriota bacterium]